MENKLVDISTIKEHLERKSLDPSYKLEWIYPENITGLNKNEIFKARNSTEWTSDIDLSEIIYKYIQEWYNQGETSLPESCAWSITEAYIRAMIYLIREYHSSLAASSVPDPEGVTVVDARNCLPFFVDVLLNCNLPEGITDTIQMYICDFYQYDDLWSPPEGRFHQELSSSENILINFLATRDLSITSLLEHGIPDEIMPKISKTKLIKLYLQKISGV